VTPRRAGGPDQDAAITTTVHISLMMAVEDAQAASAWYQQALGASVLWSLADTYVTRHSR